MGGDSTEYVGIAHDLRGVYLEDVERDDLSLRRPPGYPLFLSAAFSLPGPEAAIASFLQLILQLSTIGFVFVIGRDIFSRGAGFGAATALAIDPLSITYSNYLLTDTLFVFLVVLGSWLWVQAIRTSAIALASICGLTMAIAALTRPVGLLFPVVLIATGRAIKPGRRIRMLVALVLAFALPVGLWTARNTVATGYPGFSTIAEDNLLFYIAAGGLAEAEGISLEDAQALTGNLEEARDSKNELALELIREHPGPTAFWMLKSGLRMLVGTGHEAFSATIGASTSSLVAKALLGLQVLITLAIYATALVGSVVGYVRKRKAALFCVVAAAYFVVVSLGSATEGRFRLPAIPFLALLSGYGIERLSGKEHTSAS